MSVDSRGMRLSQELLLTLAAQGKRIDEKTLKILEEVLVDGHSQSVVAKKYQVTQQHVSSAVNRFYSRLTKQMRHVPEPLTVRCVAIHPDLQKSLEQLQIESFKLANKK